MTHGSYRPLLSTLLLLLAGSSGLRAQTLCPLSSPGQSAIAFAPGRAERVINGRVLSVLTGAGMRAQVRVLRETFASLSDRELNRDPADLQIAWTDSSGAFHVVVDQAAAYLVHVRAIGQAPARASVVVGADGLQVLVVLAPVPSNVRECMLPDAAPAPPNDGW